MRLIVSLHCIIFLFLSPLYASESKQDSLADRTVISSIPEENPRNGPHVISDFSSNEVALQAVQKNLNLFSDKIRERFSIWLSRSGRYLDMMKEILKNNNVPEEMAFIPLIESGFNPHAYSPAKAAGYWQFIASTAKRYGLQIDWWKDERRDPVKSTTAAANYLKDLYEMFGSWNLAMAAYNAGEGKIMKALNKSNSDNYWSLLSTRYIKNETKDYVPRFIAASLIGYSPENYGFENFEFHPPLNYDTVILESPVDLEVIAECAEVSVEVIKELNPELKRWCTPPDIPQYTLRIPEGSQDIFLANLSQTPEDQRFTVDIYTVRKGDTFKKISGKTGIPEQVILDLNDMEKIMPLKEGTKIYLPPKGKFVPDKEDRKIIRKASHKQKKAVANNKKSGKGKVKKISYKTDKKEHKSKSRKI